MVGERLTAYREGTGSQNAGIGGMDVGDVNWCVHNVLRDFSGVFHMSGHSKWHTIKHKKGAADAKRGKIFTRLIKELTVAARNGGGDPGMNPRLRTIIAAAKEVNMPADNIKKAILRGTGELPGVIYEEITYEAYGPGGSALIIETLTDNKNRTVGELRHMLEKHAGNLGSTNSVAWMFIEEGLHRRREGEGRRRETSEHRPRGRRR